MINFIIGLRLWSVLDTDLIFFSQLSVVKLFFNDYYFA